MGKSKKVSAIFLLLGLVCISIGVSFAFFNYTRTGTVNNIGTGRIYFNSTQNGRLQLTNIFPVKSTEVDANSLDSVTVGIIGDTTYQNGEEYLISFVNVNNTINGKKIPINYIASYEPVNNKVIGTENSDYWNERENKNANIYLLNETGGVVENKQVLVGFIKNDNTGINGTLTIKAYIDADRIAISDTYDGSEDDNHGTTNEWVDDRVIFTTEEWNSMQTTPISFQIRAESNEGIWVENTTPVSCFDLSPAKRSYLVNTSMTESELNTCVSYFTERFNKETIETIEAYCRGTGTVQEGTFQQWLDNNRFSQEEQDYLEEHNIIIDNGYKVGIANYDASCGSDVIIPKTVSAIKNNYLLNSNITESELNSCVSYFNDYFDIENNPLEEGETIEAFCQGSGTAWGNTFQSALDNNLLNQEQLDYLEEQNIISNNKETVKANVAEIGFEAFKNKNLTSVEIPNSVEYIGQRAFYNNQLTSVIIPNSVKYIELDAFSNNNITIVNIDMENIPDSLFYNLGTITNLTIGKHVKKIGQYAFYGNKLTSLIIPNNVTTISYTAFENNRLTNVVLSDEYFDNNSQDICASDTITQLSSVLSVIPRFINEGVGVVRQHNVFDADVTLTNQSGTKQCISR